MVKEYFFDKIGILKEHIRVFFQHKKKVKALENFVGTEKFPHRAYLTLVKKCMADGFLGTKESEFLDYILSVYEINYLDWAHQTKWLRGQLLKRKEPKKPMAEQVFFDFEKSRANPSITIPVHILPQNSLPKGLRI